MMPLSIVPQAANAAGGRVRERSFRAFLAAGGGRIVYALWLDIVSFQGGGPLLWAPLATMRNLFVSADNASAG